MMNFLYVLKVKQHLVYQLVLVKKGTCEPDETQQSENEK